MKWLPIAGGVILMILIAFGVWVRSVPPMVIKKMETPPLIVQGGGGMPEFMTMDTQQRPVVTKDEKSGFDKPQDPPGPQAQSKDDPQVESVEL
jgi:hypothetical protein